MDLVWDFSGDSDAISDYRVEYQTLPAGTGDSWMVWCHVENYSGNVIRIRGLSCNTGYRLRLSLLGDDDVHVDEWGGASASSEPTTTDACIVPGTEPQSVNKTFDLVIGSGESRKFVGSATFSATWQTVLETNNDVPYTYNKFLWHGLQATVPNDSVERPNFDRGDAKDVYHRSTEEDFWFFNVYDSVQDQFSGDEFSRFFPTLDYTVYSDVTWGESNVSGDVVMLGTLSDLAETIDKVKAIAEIITRYINTPKGFVIETFNCEISLWGYSETPNGLEERSICVSSSTEIPSRGYRVYVSDDST